MSRTRMWYPIALLLALFATLRAADGAIKGKLQSRSTAPAGVLWQHRDTHNLDLFYGPGGRRNQPEGPFVFLKEDLDGTNPKFSVRDRNGIKWKVKLGEEARPETVATRLVWAAGYFADEDYFLHEMKVEKMERLHRGRDRVSPGGTIHNVRLKREDFKKTGEWKWRDDPFTGSREWNGLRVMMALINNWDVKDVNNGIREIDGKRIYYVSDLGASFGTTGWSVTRSASKGNLAAYSRSKFIKRTGVEYVNFSTPSRPALIHLLGLPEFIRRVHLEWIGKQVPVSDAHWVGSILSSLSTAQIQAAFRAAGYDAEEVEQFSLVVQQRIAKLNRL